MSNVWEKFYAAVYTLATGDYSLRRRLFDAYSCNLMHLKEYEIPQEIQFDFRQLSIDITRCNTEANQETIQKTFSKIDDEEVRHMAFKILSMYERLKTIN
ncbi:hypothetical protein [Nostoc sp. NMS4]|uniref:hypothetical protein n=1 Tax=Nostoc sp. NMS4 TaxID=2815390 RepID=UPI0025E66C1F|nr:hypothetical protein [Nostoc sp. NMS4]MBN3922709.1 hypothetical protein [Nostoc sp. NMS4]